MLLLLVACSGGPAPTSSDDLAADVAFTVERPESGSESVDLAFMNQVELGDRLVVAMGDTDEVYELIIVLDQISGPGDYTPTTFRYRKGQQILLDHVADCVVSLSNASDAASLYDGTFGCTELHREDDLADEVDPYAIVDGSFSGGAHVDLDAVGERFSASGYDFELELVSAPMEGGLVLGTESVVIPWGPAQTWVLMEDGADDSLDDVVIRLSPDTDGISLERSVRTSIDQASAVQVRVSSELEITAGIEDSPDEFTGTDVTVPVWESLDAGSDSARIVIR